MNQSVFWHRIYFIGISITSVFTLALGILVFSRSNINHLLGIALIALAVIQILYTVLIYFSSHHQTSKDSPLKPIKQTDRLSAMLSTSQEQSQIIIQSIDDGVIVFDISGKISLINTAAAALAEWKVEDALGVDVRLVLQLSKDNGKALDAGDDIFHQALVNKKHVTHNFLLRGNVSKQSIISLVLSPIVLPPNNTVVGAVAVMHDVTKATKQEQERADFISTASHEMRTPVASIEGYLALALNEHVSTVDSRARGYLEKAHQATEHLGQLFQDLLTSAKAEDGRLNSHPSVVEIGDLLKNMSDDFRLLAQKKALRLDFVSGPNSETFSTATTATHNIQPPYYVLADPDRLREVLNNLFDNAVKYTDKGKITISLNGDNNVVQLYIKDTGKGISAEDVPHLFQKFYRVDNAATRSIGGTGLGLFISQKIVELYRGRIWVESQLGKGSVFYVNLPRLTTARAEQMRKEPAQAAAKTNPQPVARV